MKSLTRRLFATPRWHVAGHPAFVREKSLPQSLHSSQTFQKTVPGVFDLVTATTLREHRDGQGYQLRCPGEYEAQIIEYAGIYAVAVDFSTFRCPVKVIGADPTLPYSYLPTLDLTDMLGVDYDFLPEASHLLQLEQPEECVGTMLEFIDQLSIA